MFNIEYLQKNMRCLCLKKNPTSKLDKSGKVLIHCSQPRPKVFYLYLSFNVCHSIAWVWQRAGAQFGGAAKVRQIEGLVDFPTKLPKLPQTCPEFCMRFCLTKRVERQSDVTHGLFLFYLELYILNSAVI